MSDLEHEIYEREEAIHTLQAENERLREALQANLRCIETQRVGIYMDGSEQWLNPHYREIARVVRQALNPQEKAS
jgi:hypothetical protein